MLIGMCCHLFSVLCILKTSIPTSRRQISWSLIGSIGMWGSWCHQTVLNWLFFRTLCAFPIKNLCYRKIAQFYWIRESHCNDEELSQLLNCAVPVTGNMVTCCLWTIFSWHWIWTRLRFPVQKELSVAVSGMCRFKGLVLSILNRIFLSCMENNPAKKTGSGFSMLLESSRNRNLIIWNAYWSLTEKKIISIFHAQQEMLHNNAYSHYSAEVAKLLFFLIS